MKSLDAQIPFGQVFTPTEAEFRDFRQFVNAVSTNPKLRHVGCFKVVPPKSFAKESLWSNKALDSLTVVSPIEQQVCPRSDLFELKLVTKKSQSLRSYKEHVDREEAEAKLPKSFSPEQYEKYVRLAVLGQPAPALAALRRRRAQLALPARLLLHLEHPRDALHALGHPQRREHGRHQHALPLYRRLPHHVRLAHRGS